MSVVSVPPARFPRWVENFSARHEGVELAVSDGALRGVGGDGSHFAASLPFGVRHGGHAEVSEFLAEAVPPSSWGVLLVRKGGFAVARLAGDAVVESKVGQRHVQGRTKAGGQSQQRFARRRDNQARQAYEAAAGHAARILTGAEVIVVGGDRSAIAEVLQDARLADLHVSEPWMDVPDPRRAVLNDAIERAGALVVEVVNA